MLQVVMGGQITNDKRKLAKAMGQRFNPILELGRSEWRPLMINLLKANALPSALAMDLDAKLRTDLNPVPAINSVVKLAQCLKSKFELVGVLVVVTLAYKGDVHKAKEMMTRSNIMTIRPEKLTAMIVEVSDADSHCTFQNLLLDGKSN
jgi:hypothetical protein